MELGAGGGAYKQNPGDVIPASAYLRERLQEGRSRNPRPHRARQSDFGPRTNTGLDDDIFLAEAEESRNASARLYDSSPLAAFARYGSEGRSSVGSVNGTTLSGGGRRRRNPGAKELDEQMDRLNKQNFDLKLELDHRREQQAKMHAQIESMRGMAERAEALEEEHAELLRINSLLVEELEKRDKAMQEAVDIICDLEERVDDLEQSRMADTRPGTAQADSGYAGTDTQEQVFTSSPPTLAGPPPATGKPAVPLFNSRNNLDGMPQAVTPAKPKREPAFLSQKKPSTHALRSLFLDVGRELHPVQSFHSILSKRTSRLDEEAPQEELNSPQLSAMSESSFPEMYSPRKELSPERHEWEPEEDQATDDPELRRSSHPRAESIDRVKNWMREGTDGTPSKSNRISSPLSAQVETSTPHLPRIAGDGRFQSLNDALSNAAGHPNPTTFDPPRVSKPFLLRGQKGHRVLRTPVPPDDPGFGEPLLPPTPDTVSTRMLRASRSSVLDERSLLDVTPAQIKSFEPLEPKARVAPRQMRSSIELTGSDDYSSPYKSHGRNIPPTRSNLTATREQDLESEDCEYDPYAEKTRDLEYQGYPDGNSIADGTPSRFKGQKPTATTTVTDRLFNSADISPPLHSEHARFAVHRRRSSSEVSTSHRKPSISRADTSPTYPHSWNRAIHLSNPSFEKSPASPTSRRSAASSIRTAIPERHRLSNSRSRSPETIRSNQPQTPNIDAVSTTPNTKPPSASTPNNNTHTPKAPTITSATKSSLTQKTQQLFRRISASHTDRDRDRNDGSTSTPTTRTRELSPLPTLTTSPSSVYAQDRPPLSTRRPSTTDRPSLTLRRPSTSGITRAPTSPVVAAVQQRPGTAPRRASKDGCTRPIPPVRTATEPVPAGCLHGRTASLEVVSGTMGKGIFRRGGSIRRGEEGKERRREKEGKEGGGKRPWR